MIQIILASQSPRRKELLAQIGLEFEILPSGEEEKINTKDPAEAVRMLSRQKAADVSRKAAGDCLVIGADTVVAYDGQILGKPADEKDAAAMLRLLQGKTHSVYTGVTLLHREDGQERAVTFSEETRVTFYPMTEEEIQNYINSGEPMDKAGAYGIQGLAAAFVKKISGDYNNVVGLPVGRVWQEMKKRGWL
ncbi:MAG: Maf family protein [Ruminococcus sp.]